MRNISLVWVKQPCQLLLRGGGGMQHLTCLFPQVNVASDLFFVGFLFSSVHGKMAPQVAKSGPHGPACLSPGNARLTVDRQAGYHFPLLTCPACCPSVVDGRSAISGVLNIDLC